MKTLLVALCTLFLFSGCSFSKYFCNNCKDTNANKYKTTYEGTYEYLPVEQLKYKKPN